MPLPETSLSVRGGCNCRAIRYEIQIPSLDQRPFHPYSDTMKPGEHVHLPMIAIDHCNDCRRATGAVLPLWLCSPIDYISISLLRRSATSQPSSIKTAGEGDKISLASRETWSSAEETFRPGLSVDGSFLTAYISSEARTRYFCGRCGTNIGYRVSPMPEGWPEMLDVVMGTIDREDLESDAMIPERALWVDHGIGWVKKLATEGLGTIPQHSRTNVSLRTSE
ncbi:hypothetical protein BCIN_11g03070 [Botrytis cinerea B05.10]|uniref:CENP-V/GFA domain-containing protein n=2 Tax=Botryotinia fuckeliana TaxID=40559 RepID=A0A384JWT6_BOTFB|nr:hypothetical protein BCIN_11g03070 [Botrytis cinerea B05.10]ATZ54998.1 hypothetical protein BCIN_11g03070 [Botrytis cinerea B05.10]EMR81722.1 hypothetical protein BcDW1_9640 [Botrytis cinerea BcDW1]